MRWNVALLGLLLGTSPSQGTVRHVPSEYVTINAALDVSVAGDTVLVAPGTYSDYEVRTLQGGGPFTASSAAFLRGGVSLIGEGGRDVTRIDLASQGVGRAVPVLAYSPGPGTILVQGFTIAGAPPGNAGVWSRSLDRMIMRDCRLEDLDGGSDDAGGLYSLGADLEIYGTEFLNCRSQGAEEAAITHAEGDATLVGCSFVGCTGTAIVALDAVGVNPAYHAIVRDCAFRDNTGIAAGITQFVTLTVEDCEFVGNDPSAGPSALVVSGGSGGIIEPGPYYVRRCVFAGNVTTSGLGTFNWDRVDGTIEACTFADNTGRGLTLTYQSNHAVEIRRNIFARMSRAAIRLASLLSPPPTTSCNDFWENAENDVEGFTPDATDLFLDPLFCGPDSGDYTVAGNSPCLPSQSGACGQIGALGEGCGGVAIEPETWARMKARYRSEPDTGDKP